MHGIEKSISCAYTYTRVRREMVSMHFISLLLRRINRRAAAARPERRSINKLFSDRPRRGGVAINNSRVYYMKYVCIFYDTYVSVDMMRSRAGEPKMKRAGGPRRSTREREKRIKTFCGARNYRALLVPLITRTRFSIFTLVLWFASTQQ
jgi:hypothetical protein